MGVFPPITVCVCVCVCVWTVGNTWASDFFLLLSFVLFPPFRDASHCHFNRFGSHWIHFLMAGFKCHYILLGRSPGGGDGNPLHSWRIPWAEEPGGLQSIGSQRVRHDWVTNTLPFFPSLDFPKPIHRVSSKPSTALLGLTTPPGKHSEDRILTKISSPARL